MYNNNNATLSQNIDNNSLMYVSFTPTFGNLNFQIMPSQTGNVSNTFGVVPYLSLESLIYQQQMNARIGPTNINPGQNTGQQNIQGSYTVQDSLNNTRVSIGFNNGGY